LVKAVSIFRITPMSSTQSNSFGQYVKVSLKEKSFRRKKYDRLEMKIHTAESFWTIFKDFVDISRYIEDFLNSKQMYEF
jgi:hypothetical protein